MYDPIYENTKTFIDQVLALTYKKLFKRTLKDEKILFV